MTVTKKSGQFREVVRMGGLLRLVSCGQVDSAWDPRSKGLGLDSHWLSCVEVSGKLLIARCFCPPAVMGTWWNKNSIL